VDDVHLGRAQSSSVHPTEPLDHGVEGGKVHQGVVGIEIDAYLAS
jgi:hypothetical protein